MASHMSSQDREFPIESLTLKDPLTKDELHCWSKVSRLSCYRTLFASSFPETLDTKANKFRKSIIYKD